MKDYAKESLIVHDTIKGKIKVSGKIPVRDMDDLSIAYSPGVAAPCLAIADQPEKAYDLTIKSNMVAVVSDGSAVLGLGNIGPLAAIPVMEGKALLFKEFAGVDAFPICLDTQDTEEIIASVKRIAPVFGGINLEDIEAPKCFEIEDRLQDIGIPVFHDDQHGTAIVMFAALLNSLKIVDKRLEDLVVVVNGAGAAGINIAKILTGMGYNEVEQPPVKDIIVCDSKGAIHSKREDLNEYKQEMLRFTNKDDRSGSLLDVLKGADVFVGVSIGELLKAEDIKTMAKDPIIFALANPVPEIMPDEAYKGGAAIVGTGRSDLPNQVNNVLAFPGIFRGAMDARATRITPAMKLAAATAIANCVRNPVKERILPSTLDKRVGPVVAEAVRRAWLAEQSTTV